MFLADLNERQKEAVCHTEGPLLVLAGAGSGKTRVLTYRIAYLLAQGVPPGAILAVTFTNKAAEEMRSRVVALVGPAAEKIWVGTFHATCARILRVDGKEIGLDPRFVVYDVQDQMAAVKEALVKSDLSERNFPPRAVLASISAAKNALLDPAAYERKAATFWEKTVARLYPLYQEILTRCRAVDFDDLLCETVRLFRTRPEVLARYQDRWRYILIDEYQDTNHAQYVLVNLLAQKHRNLCVVGDDDQSIYGFRQADIRNILEFEKDYPEARVVKLEQNYRSTKNILTAANGVIDCNRGRKPKRLWTENPTGEPVMVRRTFDEREEALFVVAEIERLCREEGRSLADFAVLYRINAQSRPFEEVLIQRGLPYRVVGGLRFYERKEIRDLLAYLRFIANPTAILSFRRIVNVPKRGIGEVSVERVIDFAGVEGIDLLTAIGRVEAIPDLSVKARAGLVSFARAVNAAREAGPVLEVTKTILAESGYLEELRREGTPEAQARMENIEEFLALAGRFDRESEEPGLASFLETVALVAEADEYDPDAEAVTLMTLHAAKGLEFPVVFLVGLEEGLFPHLRAKEESDLEEERRLCYVGMTRAMERLYLTHASFRAIYGEPRPAIPSRFLAEVPQEVITEADSRPDRAAIPSSPAPPRSSQAFEVGERVGHAKWGPGTIVEIRGHGEEALVVVAFPGMGLKTLAVAHAPLTRVEM
ncbi:MAG: DNA helicase PcrA [Firmicutes bacterium]|nr:DNA helicase PcrA [Bacillota bacterium]